MAEEENGDRMKWPAGRTAAIAKQRRLSDLSVRDAKGLPDIDAKSSRDEFDCIGSASADLRDYFARFRKMRKKV